MKMKIGHKNGVLQWLFIFDTPRSIIITLPWKHLIFQIKTKSFSETGLSLKWISLLIIVLTDVFTMDIKSHVYLHIFCYTPMGIKYKQPLEHPIFMVCRVIPIIAFPRVWTIYNMYSCVTYVSMCCIRS